MLTWLKGIIPPLTTPFDERGKVWAAALEAEIDHQIACGAQGICVTGSTGEGAGLTPDEIFEISSIAVKHTRGRVPVVGGMIPDTTDEAVELALAAKKAGVEALQVTPPPRSADKRWLVQADLRCSVGAARKQGRRELGEVPGCSKIFHPLGVKIAGFFPLCVKSPSLPPPPRPCCSSLIPSL